ncbi:hypothetical protein [Microbulbifer halophilus]|uniref:Uncharacterized protein n=1 Tax=Microbulbifer halophilus TaxID=453963 RepID=A0ABW5EBE6_9GAMM|nr:hypothetical protein [Microbulbifer halophilus]MCW8128285.1 hypothetical protein [Microbulbifer halophilus]
MDFLSFPLQRILCLLCLLLACGPGHAKSHPSYLTPKYCESVVEQFVDAGMRSLDTYVNEHFDPRFGGGIRNTINFLEQREGWLSECNDYLLDTNQGSIFYSEKLTREIFIAMNELATELQHVREGVEYPDSAGNNNPAPFIKRHFQDLAELVDQHHTHILMKKQFQ